MIKLTTTAALVVGLASAGAYAAELGEATVRSHAGDQLVADVELVDLTPQDLADLQVRLASRNVFQGANVSMSPALAGISITVTKRDGRRSLHLTTSAPIQSEVLHLYFELTSGGRQSVRGVSLWLPAAPPAAPAPVPVAQPTRVVAAPVVPTPEPAPRARPSSVTVQLAAAPTPGKEATRTDTELLGAVERAFAARSARKTSAPAEAGHARPMPVVEAKPKEKPVIVVAKAVETPAPAVTKAAEKIKVAEKPAASIIPPLPVIARPTEPVPDKAMLKKLAELEAKLKTLQAAVARNAVAPVAPKAPVVPKAAAAPAPAAVPASHVEQSAAVVTATEPPGRSAAGKITDVRSDKPESDEKPAAQPAPPPEVKKAPPPPPEPEKKMSRPKVLTMIAGGTLGLMLVIGVIVHFVRRRKAKQASAQIKVWQSWRKKAIAEAATAEEEAPAESGAA